MPICYLPDEDHVLRYVPWARLRKDENDNVLGVLGTAFVLRENEEYLSATWVEFFSGTVEEQVHTAVRTIRASNIDVKPKSGFAIGNVGRIKGSCLADKGKHKIRVIHEPVSDNDAHTALRQWPRENDDLLALLAEDVWNDFILNKAVAT